MNKYTIHCLNIHSRLQIPMTINTHLLLLLSSLKKFLVQIVQLPSSFRLGSFRWPTLCSILFELDPISAAYSYSFSTSTLSTSTLSASCGFTLETIRRLSFRHRFTDP